MRRYPVLINNIDDDNKPSIILSVVDESDSPDLNVPLERLHKSKHMDTVRT